MSKPLMFIGSSKESLRVAKALAEDLEEDVEVTVWNEGIFDLNRGMLEELLKKLDSFDFALVVLAPDDMTHSRGKTKQSPRDNVLFECGLFMGKLGRDRIFIAYDESIELMIPSDFAGVTLAPYNGSRMTDSPQASVRKATRLISEAIKKVEFNHLVGEWRSRYRLSFEMDHPMVEEDIEIKQSRGKICFISRKNPVNDNYTAYADLAMDRHLIGEWNSLKGSASTNGAFLLTIHPNGNLLYGFFTGPDENHRVIYCPWILARKDQSGNAGRLLARGETILQDTSRLLMTNETGLISAADPL